MKRHKWHEVLYMRLMHTWNLICQKVRPNDRINRCQRAIDSNITMYCSLTRFFLIFLGDNAMMKRFGQMRHGTFKGNITALDLAIERNAGIYVPGHGPSGGSEVPETFRRYLSTLREQVAAQLDEGLSDFEMKPIVVEALKEFQDWVDFDQLVGKHISQAYLEVEAETF